MFLNPFTMMAGGLLVSSPIIIHLINRMRYKRIRWAAMEFLLKSQKKKKRQLIIQQLLLLLLRILIVLVLALLLARFMGFDPSKPPEDKSEIRPSVLNIVIIDDSASMADATLGRDGRKTTALKESATAVMDRLLIPAGKTPDPQYFVFLKLSDLDETKSDFGQLGETTLPAMNKYLDQLQIQNTHLEWAPALQKAQEVLEKQSEEFAKLNKPFKKAIHLVGDFRTADWSSQTYDRLNQYFERFKEDKVAVNWLDVASPEREKNKTQESPRYTPNLALVDFRAMSRMATKDTPVEFTLSLLNNAVKEEEVRVVIRVNGKKQDAASRDLRLQAGEIKPIQFQLTFGGGEAPKVDDPNVEKKPYERFNIVSAHLEFKEGKEDGLSADNVRYTLIEIQDKTPILLVDDNPAEYRKKGSESFFIWKILAEIVRGYDVQIRPSTDLDKMSLEQYAAIYLCNIKKFSEPARKKLEAYVAGGGGVAFFMGPAITPEDVKAYNKDLYNSGKGIFPVPLEEKYKHSNLTEEQLSKVALAMRASLTKKLMVRKNMQKHPALRGLYPDASSFRGLGGDEFSYLTYAIAIPRYFVVNRRALANAELKNTELLMHLPYFGSLLKEISEESAEYERQIFNETNRLIKKLPIDDPKYSKYKPQLTLYQRLIQNSIGASSTRIPDLAFHVENLLLDPGDEVKQIPSLEPFWQDPDMKELRTEFELLLDQMQYGDPVYVSKPYGKGRVIAYLSSAGTSWNPSDSGYFIPFIRDSVQPYLAGAGTEFNLPLGASEDFTINADQYDGKVDIYLAKLSEGALEAGQAEQDPELKLLSSEVLETAEDPETKAKTLKLSFKQTKDQGVYFFKFLEKRISPEKGEIMVPSYRARAFNFDTTVESNLERAMTEDITRITKGTQVLLKDEEESRTPPPQKKGDLSESPWLYLLMLLLLIGEQALAVRLSFHSSSAELDSAPRPVATGRGVLAA